MTAGTRMSAEVADAIRQAAARDALATIKSLTDRHDSTPEVAALAIEGLLAGAAAYAWRNRHVRVKARTFARRFAGIAADMARKVMAVRERIRE